MSNSSESVKNITNEIESETTEEQLIGKIKTDEDIHKFIMNKKIKKSIYITNKLINIITEWKKYF